MENFTKYNDVLQERGYPLLGEELSQDDISKMRIGSAFYVVRNTSTPLLSMMMGVTDNALVKVAQLSAGRVAFALNSVGERTKCFQALL